MKKKFVVSKSVYEFALKYQGLQGEISGAFPHQIFTIPATSGELEDLFSLLRFLKTTQPPSVSGKTVEKVEETVKVYRNPTGW